ncbi:MAG: hypothetical protein ACREBU_07445 [Nitrososphaera sp.]
MSAITTIEHPEFKLKLGRMIVQNEAAEEVSKLYSDLRKKYYRMTSSWAGAFVVSMFVRFPWLSAMTISMSASSEYDDEGGSYRSISIAIDDVDAEPGVPFDAELEFDGQLETGAAEETLRIYIEDYAGAAELYECFADSENSYDDLRLSIKRETIADLIGNDEVGGTEAFLRLFPDYASCVIDKVAVQAAG